MPPAVARPAAAARERIGQLIARDDGGAHPQTRDDGLREEPVGLLLAEPAGLLGTTQEFHQRIITRLTVGGDLPGQGQLDDLAGHAGRQEIARIPALVSAMRGEGRAWRCPT